jgi:hypothetical protein
VDNLHRREFFATMAAVLAGAKLTAGPSDPASISDARAALRICGPAGIDFEEFRARYIHRRQPAAQQMANQIDNEVLGIKPPGFPDNYRWYPEDLEEEDLHG